MTTSSADAVGAVPDPPILAREYCAAMTTTTKADVFERFGRSHIEVADFESDVTVEDWAQLYRTNTINLGPLFFSPFAEVSPSKLKAAAHTDTNLIQPSVVITDTTGTPYAGLDMRDTPARQPAVSVHFLPSDFGITGVGNYVFRFYVESTSSITLKASGLTFLQGVTVQGLGSSSGSGQRTISVTYLNLPPGQPVTADITQTAGEQWAWYRTSIGHPPLIFTP